MKIIFSFIAVIIFNSSIAQKIVRADYANGIYLSDSDYTNHHLFHGFNKKSSVHSFIELREHLHQIWIKAEDSTYKFYFSDIWGYRKDGEDWRVYDEVAYRIEDTVQVCIYTVPDFANGAADVSHFFSKNLTSQVHILSKNDLLEVYHSNAAFVEKVKELKWDETILKWNKKKQRYQFVDWLDRE